MFATISKSRPRILKVFVAFLILWCTGVLVIGASIFFHEMGWRTAQLAATLLTLPIATAWLCCCAWFVVEILSNWAFPRRRRT